MINKALLALAYLAAALVYLVFIPVILVLAVIMFIAHFRVKSKLEELDK